MQKIKKKTWGILTALCLFALMLQLTKHVTFMQNDDWYYYREVTKFLAGDFVLDKDIAPTFYLQGIMAMPFAKALGISKLPVLTLAVAVLNFYLLYIILVEPYKKGVVQALLVALLFFVTPLNIYTVLGFMTEQYFLLFMLLAIYCFRQYDQTQSTKWLGGFLLAVIASFFVRQIGLLLPITAGMYWLIKKQYTHALKALAVTLVLGLFYAFIFPKTPEMQGKTLDFTNLTKFDYSYAIIYGSLVYLAAVTLPLVAIFMSKSLNRKLLVTIAVAVGLYFALQQPFKPMTVSWGEFPYFENTWERTGFMAREIHGTKYQFKGIYDLYLHWDTLAKIGVALLLASLLFSGKLKHNLFCILFSTGYLGIMLLTHTFYDRYVLILVPIFLMLLAGSINLGLFGKLTLMAFTGFIAFYSYTLATDYVLAEAYVWNKATQLTNQQALAPKTIFATGAWQEQHGTAGPETKFIFSYDSPHINQDQLANYKLKEQKAIDYPFNIHINPAIYLYEKTN